MLKAIDFPEANANVRPPEGILAELHTKLPAFKGFNDSFLPVVITCWEIGDEAFEILKRDRKIYLHVLGTTMPIVALTFNPFLEREEKPDAKSDIHTVPMGPRSV